nr:MAG TPA: hypothetical protein [Caudoviricetes sp.]
MKIFNVDTKNGRAMRTLLQGFLGAMGTFTALYSVPQFTEFMRSLDTLTGSIVFSSGSAIIAAGISRLMPVIEVLVEMLKEKVAK